MSRLKSAKVATPFTAATVFVPLSCAPVPPASATVTKSVKAVATLPSESSALTWTAGAITLPAAVVVGCTVNTRLAAAAGVMVNAALATAVKPALEAVSV